MRYHVRYVVLGSWGRHRRRFWVDAEDKEVGTSEVGTIEIGTADEKLSDAEDSGERKIRRAVILEMCQLVIGFRDDSHIRNLSS